MKTLKIIATLAAPLFVAGLAFAAADAKSEAKAAACCATAAKDGKTCAHACCVTATKAGNNCTTCGGVGALAKKEAPKK